jgi:hypothetical protein
VRYEADGNGFVYVEHDDGQIWPTGRVLSVLAGRSNITPEEYIAARDAHDRSLRDRWYVEQ